MRLRAAMAPLILAAAVTPTLRAQTPEPLFDRLTHAVQHDWLSVGALVQVVADAQVERTAPGSNGFSIANARLGISGRLDGGFSYSLQAAFTATPAVLDARLGYRVGSWGTIDVGRFKPPFSRERLTSTASLDFVTRARAMASLAPGRQVGAQLHGRLATGHVEYGVGAFNGNGLASGNDDGHLLYLARASWWAFGDPSRGPADRRLEIGVSAGRSTDSAVALGDLVPEFRGDRTLLGADARWRHGRLLLAAEVVAATLDSLGGGTHHAAGWHTTVGYHATPHSQVLARWDALRPDGLAPRSDWLVLGWNRWPTQATEVQVNWIVDVRDAAPNHSQLLVNMQIGF